MATRMNPFYVVTTTQSIFSAMRRLFKMEKVTHMASVELWVLITTLLLVVRFVLDFFGPWNANRSMVATIQIIEMLNYSMVHYTMGLMQLSAARVNDYFQVWAVLLVTLQYSVKIGRPYSRSKQLPLLDLMSSLWTANLIRLQTFLLLKIPLWIIWFLNSVRMISYFLSSDKAANFNQENTRLVSDYMRYEHTIGAPEPCNSDKELTASHNGDEELMMMQRYRYLVLGEDEALKEFQKKRGAGRAAPGQYSIRLDGPGHEKLVTLDKIWSVASSSQGGLLGSSGNRDICLSFSLYKLLRRRFYNLPLHEVGQNKTAELVFDYILKEDGGTGSSYERAFRVAALELSFLQDLFYSKHAAMFVGGFPVKSLLLSVLLIAATGHIAYPVHRIPERMDQADRNTITHGVFITRLIVALIVCKELSEIYLYVFSQWTKVLILCKHVRRPCPQHRLAETVMRIVFWFINRGEWDQNICQYNLLISPICQRFRFRSWCLMFEFRIQMLGFSYGSYGFNDYWGKTSSIKLEPEVKKALLDSFKLLKGSNPETRLGSYFDYAFRSNEGRMQKLAWAVDDLEADTHRILVWHIATCLCEINLFNQVTKFKVTWLQGLQARPLIDRSSAPVDVWPHYETASTLSNYCAYLVTKALVPDNGLVANKVFRVVYWETVQAFFNRGLMSLQDVYDYLVKRAEEHEQQVPIGEQKEDPATNGSIISEQVPGEKDAIDEAQDGNDDSEPNGGVPQESSSEEDVEGGGGEDDDKKDNTIVLMGTKLAMQLIDLYGKGEDMEGLWRELAQFWVGFLLHLAASTRAAKHRTRLVRRGELITILWALLSHAGFLGSISHGHTLQDPADLDDADPLS